MDKIIGNSLAIKEAKRVALQIAESDAPVLLLGETGVGKELFADFIQSNSHRKNKSFVKVNCAAIQDALLESDLFGHEKGAFTGAIVKKVGKLQIADNGTIFLDEVPNMSLAIQAKVLRALEHQQFESVGGTDTIRVDVRIISASNKNMNRLLKNGQFRNDLFFRLGVFILTIPPLRERQSDIDKLSHHFATLYKTKYKKNIKRISPKAMKILHAYEWPGNVRELKNVIERAVLFCEGDTIKEEHVSLEVDIETAAGEMYNSMTEIADRLHGNGYRGKMVEGIKEIEKAWIELALAERNFVQKNAADDLGISTRVLCYKMQNYGISCQSPYGSSKGGSKKRKEK